MQVMHLCKVLTRFKGPQVSLEPGRDAGGGAQALEVGRWRVRKNRAGCAGAAPQFLPVNAPCSMTGPRASRQFFGGRALPQGTANLRARSNLHMWHFRQSFFETCSSLHMTAVLTCKLYGPLHEVRPKANPHIAVSTWHQALATRSGCAAALCKEDCTSGGNIGGFRQSVSTFPSADWSAAGPKDGGGSGEAGEEKEGAEGAAAPCCQFSTQFRV